MRKCQISCGGMYDVHIVTGWYEIVVEGMIVYGEGPS